MFPTINMSDEASTPSKSPFIEADFQRIYDEEKTNNEKEGWQRVKKSREVEVWRKKVPNVDDILVKGFIYLPGVSVEDAVEMLTNLDLRSRWDKQFYIIETLEVQEEYKVVYWATKLPWPCSSRDIIQYATVRKEPGMVTILYKNASHEKRPIQPDIIRAETIFSGVIIRVDEQDPNSSRMSLLMQTDMKGWLPKFIVNHSVIDAPANWHRDLLKFYRDVYSKEKGDKE